MKSVVEFDKRLWVQFDDDQDLHLVLKSEDKQLSIEIANCWNGGGNREVYQAALALKEAIDKHGYEY